MDKKVIIGAAAGTAAIAAAAAAKKRSAEPRPTMFEKMQAHMEAMPEDFPPRMMFDNVEATRANTERILELLEERGAGAEHSTGDDVEVLEPV